jgi:phosphoribosylaminoimidazole-succinocarboxamide synthase
MNVDPGSGPIVVYREFPSEQADSASPRSSDDKDYFRAREHAERAAAKAAVSTRARRIHQQLAQVYAQLARQAHPTGA